MKAPQMALWIGAACFGLASAGNAGEVLRLPSPLVPLPSMHASESLEVEFTPAAHALLKPVFDRREVVRLDGFSLPGDEVDLLLRPISCLPAEARATVVHAGGESRLLPSIAMFSGHALGRVSSVFLAVSSTLVQGYLSIDGVLYFVSSGGSSAGTARVAKATAFPPEEVPPAWCDLVDPRPVAGARDVPGSAGAAPRAAAQVRIADLFVECDHVYRSLFHSDQEAIDYAALLFTATSEIYRRDVGAVLQIPNGYLRLWTVIPPWGVISTFNDITAVQSYWTSPGNPLRNTPRAAVHVLTNPVFGGVAWNIGGICDNSEGYEVSSVFGSFPHPILHTDANNWDLLVVAHECGHSFGSGHAFDYSPPIDCVDGSGPDSGTLMGYCHLNPGGVANVGMRFHERVQAAIIAYMNSVGCLTTVSHAPGDYDLSGTLDAADLAALDACLHQGFYSQGCIDSMDLDGDGALTACDYGRLNALIQGYAIAHYADPLQPATGSPLTLGVCQGVPGNPLGYSVVDVSGTPVFAWLRFAVLDASGAHSLSSVVIPGFSGFTFTFRAFTLTAGGAIARTNDATIAIP